MDNKKGLNFMTPPEKEPKVSVSTKSKRVTFWIDEENEERVNKATKKEKRSVAFIINRSIENDELLDGE